MSDVTSILDSAYHQHMVIPSFNIPHLEMMEPVVAALQETDTFALIAVARLEWRKFASKSLEAVAEEYHRVGDARVTRLHLDHIPVIDEDQERVDYADDIVRAIACGYSSVMIDGSRLPLEENIRCVREVTDYAHAHDIPVEAELGAVVGHESGPEMDYEQLFATGKGFTDIAEAGRFVSESKVDWLSVAVGSVHGAISGKNLNRKKVTARLNIEYLDHIDRELGIPLVLHGGSGIDVSYLRQSFDHGIAKLNIGTDIRQAYERGNCINDGQRCVHTRVLEIISELGIAGSAQKLRGGLS